MPPSLIAAAGRHHAWLRDSRLAPLYHSASMSDGRGQYVQFQVVCCARAALLPGWGDQPPPRWPVLSARCPAALPRGRAVLRTFGHVSSLLKRTSPPSNATESQVRGPPLPPPPPRRPGGARGGAGWRTERAARPPSRRPTFGRPAHGTPEHQRGRGRTGGHQRRISGPHWSGRGGRRTWTMGTWCASSRNAGGMGCLAQGYDAAHCGHSRHCHALHSVHAPFAFALGPHMP